MLKKITCDVKSFSELWNSQDRYFAMGGDDTWGPIRLIEDGGGREIHGIATDYEDGTVTVEVVGKVIR